MFIFRRKNGGKHITLVKYETDEEVRTALIEFLLYSIFLILATIMINALYHVYMFHFNYSMQKLFVEREVHSDRETRLTFETIVSIPDFWIYFGRNFMEGIHGIGYNESRIVLRDNVLLGPPRIRQMRVKKNTCYIKDAFRRYFDHCYTGYSSWAEDTNETYKETKYYTRRELGATCIYGEVTDYYGGGYVKTLYYEREQNDDILSHLRSVFWINRGTRIVLLEAVLYNVNTDIYENMKIIAEIPPVGGLFMWSQFQAIKKPLLLTGDIFLYIIAVLFYLMALLYTIEEVLSVIAKGCRTYVSSIWNLLDIIILVLVYLSLVFNIVYPAMFKSMMQKVALNDNDAFLSIDGICYWDYLYINMMAICLFLIWLKMFKFISFNRTMLRITTTIQRSAKDLLGFLVMFIVVFIAYAQLGLLLFGAYHPDFQTFEESIMTLVRMLLGDLDYTRLEQANYVLGPLFFVSYVLLVFFILLNMFLAVINDVYISLKSEMLNTEHRFCPFFLTYWNKLLKCCGLHQPIEDDSEIELATTSSGMRPALKGILKEYYEETDAPANEVQEAAPATATELQPSTSAGPPTADQENELKELKTRIETLEDKLESLIKKMDSIIKALDKTRHSKDVNPVRS